MPAVAFRFFKEQVFASHSFKSAKLKPHSLSRSQAATVINVLHFFYRFLVKIFVSCNEQVEIQGVEYHLIYEFRLAICVKV